MKNDFRIVTFESSDSYFGILADASKHYVSARKKNAELLAALKQRGVAFKDIRAFMLNRAIEIGLFEKGMRESEVSNRGWYVMLQSFLRFKNNYEDYGILKVKEAKKPKGDKAIVTTKTVVRTKDADGKVIERETSKEETLRERVERIKAEHKANAEAALMKPISESLSSLQVQQIILQNFSVLGKICEEKGAVSQFNALMAVLGQFDELIESDDPEILEEASQPYTEIDAPVM